MPRDARVPPYQIVPGDKHNLTLGVMAAFLLGTCKSLPGLPPLARWQLNAYTNWNLAFCALRVAAGQAQWDPFLLVNSVGIVCGFRTAFAQGLDDNMRIKFRGFGVNLPRWLFVALDHLCHSVPPALLLGAVLRRGDRVHPMNSVYALVLSTWFAFRQNSTLDASDIYVPHPWKRAWLGILVAVMTTPPLVDSLRTRNTRASLLYTLALCTPWLMSKLDPNLKRKYQFECMLANATSDAARRSEAAARRHNGVPRVMSEVPLTSHIKGEMS